MVGVDIGTELTKWFDGERFGTGTPSGDAFSVGISSKGTLVRVSSYPLCSGRNLEKMMVAEVEAETGIPSEEIEVSYCSIEKLPKGCRFIVFVERKGHLWKVVEELKDRARHVTVDIVGVVSATLSVYGKGYSGTVIDAGASKVSAVKVENGKPVSVDIIRTGFKGLMESRELSNRLLGAVSGRTILVGGGALSEEFRGFLEEKGIDFEVPEFEPFGAETPLYYASFGLYRFRTSGCRADFKKFHLLGTQVISKHRNEILFSAVALLLSLILITAGEYMRFLSAKRDYRRLNEHLKSEVSKVLGVKRVVAPKIQLRSEIERLREEADFLLIGSPSILVPLDAISESVVGGVNVKALSVNILNQTAKISGIAKDEKSIDAFRRNLLKRFESATVSFSKRVKKGVKFTVEVKGVKVEF